MKINDNKIVNRWNNLMGDLCLEYLMIIEDSELVTNKRYYNIEDNISAEWMSKELKYWLSCYYENGHCRCDDRFLGKAEYKTWVSETERLKRFIDKLENLSDDYIIVEWD